MLLQNSTPKSRRRGCVTIAETAARWPPETRTLMLSRTWTKAAKKAHAAAEKQMKKAKKKLDKKIKAAEKLNK